MERQPQDTFDDAATQLFHAFAQGDDATIASQNVRTVADRLHRLLQRSYGLSSAEAEETAQDVIVKVIELARTPGGGLDQVRNPGAYLTRLARNRAIDQIRRSSRDDAELSPELAHSLPSRDDAIAALLDASATAARIRAAMQTADRLGDHLALETVRLWLDMADKTGEPPSSRDIATKARVSHTAINQALRRFRRYLPAN